MEISPEKSQMMSFLEEDPVISEMIVGNKCLQQAKNFKYLGCEISYGNEKDIQQKIAKFTQILRILNNTFKPNSVQIFSRIKYIMHWLFPIFYMEEKFEPLEKRIKKIHTQMEFFRRTAWNTLFDHKRNEEILEEVRAVPADKKL